MDFLKNELKHVGIEYIENFDTIEISTIKISAKIYIAIFPKCQRELVCVLRCLYKHKLLFRVFGNSSNILFCEKISVPVIFTSKMKDEYNINGNFVSVCAGMQLSRLIEIAKRNKLGGIEQLVGIPATVGGAIFNNAGAFGKSISSKLVKITAFYEGRVIDISCDEIKFGYHFSNLKGIVILSALFLFENKNEYDIIKLCNEYSYKRTVIQPNGFSLGSVFQKVNGKSAGFYIERVGLKQKKIGGIFVSNKHANFFLNDKNGTFCEFIELQELAKKRVCEQFGLTLVSEIEKVGDNYETSCGSSHTLKK